MRLSSFLLIASFARLAAAQSGATVSGVVRDSISQTTLAGASVQLVGAERGGQFIRTAVSDGSGRFQLNDVPDGRYRLGFFHSRLDSLGLEPVLREITVVDQRAVRADLATPSAASLRTALCGVSSDIGAILIGTVRDARSRSNLADAAAGAEWLEYEVNRTGIALAPLSARATTKANGWFVFCGLPRDGAVVLVASRGADSTDQVEVEMPADQILRRDLYLGSSRVVASEDTIVAGDSLIRSPRTTRVGDGRLVGRVVATLGGQAVAGAQVGLVDGPQTRANERGEWTLVNAAPGTRWLEIRAVGYFPERRPVDVVADAPPVEVEMRTMKSVLDTVRVVEARFNNRNFTEFERRSRGGMGNYITMADIERQKPLTISEMFRISPGVRTEGSAILVRGMTLGWCAPRIFIDGMNIGTASAGELDAFVDPDEIAGIEVHSGTSVPPQFNTISAGGARCGAIVIWTKMRPSTRGAFTKRRALVMTSLVGLSFVAGVFFTRQ